MNEIVYFKHHVDYDDALGIDCDQTAGDMATYSAVYPMTILRAGAVITETCAGATTTPIVKFDKRPTAGSNSGRGDGDAGVLTMGTSAAGKILWDEEVNLYVNQGEQVVVELTQAASGTGAAGHFQPFMEVKVHTPDNPANLTKSVIVG